MLKVSFIPKLSNWHALYCLLTVCRIRALTLGHRHL